MPLAHFITVVDRKIAATSANKVELDEINLPASKLLDDGVDIGARSWLGGIDFVDTLQRATGLTRIDDVADVNPWCRQ